LLHDYLAGQSTYKYSTYYYPMEPGRPHIKVY
jgi:hypothetical protein